jgi:hypothetical protein
MQATVIRYVGELLKRGRRFRGVEDHTSLVLVLLELGPGFCYLDCK